jgi:hypothetical protein
MADDLAALADILSAVLDEETALLEALDLPAAAKLLDRKRDAVAALQGAVGAGSGVERDEDEQQALRESVRHMAERAEANRAAIEHGLAMQMKLIETIAKAVPIGRAEEAPTYQPNGSRVATRPPEAYAFLSRM